MSFNLTAQFLDERRHEVQRQSHFKIQIKGLSEELTLHVRSANLPSVSFDTLSTRYGNEENKQAGNRSFNDLSLTVHDAVGLDMERQLHAWQQQVQNTRTGVMGYASDYKRTAIITEYTINGEVRSRWEFRGVWPSSISFGDLSRDGTDKKSLSMTLTYDKAWLV